MKTNDGHLEYSLGDGAQAGLRQRPVAHVDASSTCCSSVGGSIPAIAIPIPDPVAVAVAVKKVINHALGWRLEGVRVKAGGERPAASASFSVDLSGRLAVGRMGGFGGWQTHASGQHKSRHKGVQKY